ncbi:MAG: CNP1-like family protein [Betaproteobacteria bacterium]
MKIMHRAALAVAAIACAASSATAQLIPIVRTPSQTDFENDFETKPWEEVATQLPPLPLKKDLSPFYVSAATEHRFFIDPEAVSVGQDGVVRYTVVIETSGGANNTSYEGMRCQTREWRHYASGHPGIGWSKTRNAPWHKIREEPSNRFRAALFSDFFCPEGVIASLKEIRFALKREAERSR